MRGNLASTYLASGDVDAGIQEFRKAVEIAPENSRIRAGLAVSYFALGRYEEAVKEFDRAKLLGAQFEPSVREALERLHTPTHPES
jgi:Flp pilus assembly protein TadD